MKEYGVWYDGAYHIFRFKEDADEFVESMPLVERRKCIRLYSE